MKKTEIINIVIICTQIANSFDNGQKELVPRKIEILKEYLYSIIK